MSFFIQKRYTKGLTGMEVERKGDQIAFKLRRCVQYVHCVLHKCVMVKAWGKRKTQKVCKKDANFTQSGGKFAKVGGNENLSEIGEWTERAKIGVSRHFSEIGVNLKQKCIIASVGWI